MEFVLRDASGDAPCSVPYCIYSMPVRTVYQLPISFLWLRECCVCCTGNGMVVRPMCLVDSEDSDISIVTCTRINEILN